MKNIEDKIGRDPDPLHKHQYFKTIIALKTFKFNERGTKFLKANCDRTLKCTHGRTKFLNNSTAHSEERGGFQKCRSEPTAELKNSNYSKNPNSEDYGEFPTKPTRAPERQVAHGTSSQPDWWKDVSAETTYPKKVSTRFPTEIPPQDSCERTEMTEGSFQYNDEELASA